jgi:cellulose synthase/poly-beta-1,6-N-acetylglucosamine synthase-like glycosyltransferase
MIIFLLFLLLLFSGIVWLQIFLSKKNNKWFGLILPFICLMFSLLIVFNIATFSSIQTTVTETVDGFVISEETKQIESEKPGMLSIIGTILPVFLISNIPTLVLLAIYYASREKLKIRNQLDKMNIQDLE